MCVTQQLWFVREFSCLLHLSRQAIGIKLQSFPNIGLIVNEFQEEMQRKSIEVFSQMGFYEVICSTDKVHMDSLYRECLERSASRNLRTLTEECPQCSKILECTLRRLFHDE